MGLTRSGFLTEVSVRIEGDPMASTITGGPVKVELWLGRGSFYRKLCSGGIYNELTVKGSGMLPIASGDRIIVKWSNLTATDVLVRLDSFVDEQTIGESAPGWTDETPDVRIFQTLGLQMIQSNAGGGNVVLKITPVGAPLRPLRFSARMADTAAGRATSVYIYDEDGNAQAIMASSISLDNQSLQFPTLGVAPVANNLGMYTCPETMILPPDGTSLALVSVGLVQNESVYWFGVLEHVGFPTATPTLDVASSTGTVAAPTETQNEWTVVKA